ncbi:hypothetical protein EC973_004049 [Apophysomyces ossiformis]|uniref:F-box domain-containing protein n=1 Tax=Apophysomyces ossiformis TaxID=679940 RepID=A0A8H7ETE2_9FUNG|nr:hypothetical protein EC973_004049 [Apophysomyces ossiformis]
MAKAIANKVYYGYPTSSSQVKNLPAEILINIANRLSRRNLCNLVRVCRSWNRALTPVLYETTDTLDFVSLWRVRSLFSFVSADPVSFVSKTHNLCPLSASHLVRLFEIFSNDNDELFVSLKEEYETSPLWKPLPFFDTLLYTETNKRLGHYVRILTNTDQTIVGSGLRRLCPHLTEIHSAIPGPLLFLLAHWRHLRKISLDVCLPQPLDFPTGFLEGRLTDLSLTINSFRGWLEVFSKIGSIQRLTMKFSRPKNNEGEEKILFEQFEALHRALPQLQFLALSDFRIRGEIPEHIAPCETMRSLLLFPPRGVHWGLYLARKYTKLETLSLLGSVERTEIVPLATSCQNLRSLIMTATDVYYRFLQGLQAAQAPMTYISYERGPLTRLPDLIHGFCCTIKKLDINIEHEPLKNMPWAALKACTRLTELRLKSSGGLFLDSVVEILPNLKKLSLIAYRVVLSELHGTRSQPYLKQLTMEATLIENGVYVYLSRYCSFLSSLICVYHSYIPKSSVIYYPNQSLQYLVVCSPYDCNFKIARIEKAKPCAIPTGAGQMGWRCVRAVHRLHRLQQLTPSEVNEMLPHLVTIICHFVDDIILNGIKLTF